MPQIVRSVPLPQFGPAYTGYEIVDTTAADVQAAINKIHDYVDARMGEAHFELPAKCRTAEHFGRYRAVGYTILAPLDLELSA